MVKALLERAKRTQDSTAARVLVVLEAIDSIGGHDTANGAFRDAPSISGAVFGLMRSVRTELPQWFKVVCMTSDARGNELAEQVHNEMRTALQVAQSQATIEVRYINGERACPQLRASKEHLIGDVCLDLTERGKLSNLKLKEQPAESQVNIEVEAAMVEVEVHAVGLNFKDLLNVIVPDGSGFIGKVPLPGTDFAGVVTQTLRREVHSSDAGGDDIPANHNELNIGDRVFGLCMQTGGMLRSRALLRTDTLTKIPKGWDMTDASALPTVRKPVEQQLDKI